MKIGYKDVKNVHMIVEVIFIAQLEQEKEEKQISPVKQSMIQEETTNSREYRVKDIRGLEKKPFYVVTICIFNST